MLYFTIASILVVLNGTAFFIWKSRSKKIQPLIAESTPTLVPETRTLQRKKKKLMVNINGTQTLKALSRIERRPTEIPHHLAWYYRVDTRAAGPYLLEELVAYMDSGRITEKTLVWSENLLEDWTPVRDVDLLHAMRNAASQPIELAAEALV